MADTSTQSNQTLSPEDAQKLIQQLVGWAKAGGGNAPQVSMATDSQGNQNPVMSPQIAADSAQNISGGQQGNGGNNMQGNQQPPPQPNAYQKGVNKFLTQAGQTHAQQAIQAGVDPNAIAAHPAMQPAQQSMYMNNPYQIPTGVNPPKQNNQVPTGSPSNYTQEKNIEQKTQENLAQARLLTSQSIKAEAMPKNFLQRFSDNFSKMTGGMTSTDRIANTKTLQSIAGGEPIQPTDAAKLDEESRNAALTANGQLLEAASQPVAALSSMYRDQLQTRGWNAGVRGIESPAMADTKTQLLTQLQRLQTYANTQSMLIGSMNPQTQNVMDLINEAKKRAASGNNKFSNFK